MDYTNTVSPNGILAQVVHNKANFTTSRLNKISVNEVNATTQTVNCCGCEHCRPLININLRICESYLYLLFYTDAADLVNKLRTILKLKSFLLVHYLYIN